MRKLLTILFVLTGFLAQSQAYIGNDGAVHPTGSFPVVISNEGKGTPKSKKSLVQRNAIPASLRDTGMICWVADSTKFYVLSGGIDNANWIEWTSSSAGGSNITQAQIDYWNTVGLKADQNALLDSVASLRASFPVIPPFISYNPNDFDTTNNVLSIINKTNGESDPIYSNSPASSISDQNIEDINSISDTSIHPRTDDVRRWILQGKDTIWFDARDFYNPGTKTLPLRIIPSGLGTENGLIKPGYVTWSGTGYTYDVTGATYAINNTVYTSDQGSVSLDAADGALNRIDAIVLDTFGHITKITGVAASNPVAPIPDPSSQLLLTNVSVNAGSTGPNSLNTVVWNEKGFGEYITSASGTTQNPDNQNFPYSGAKSLDIGGWTSGNTVTFTNGATANATSYTYFKFFIRLKSVVTDYSSIAITFFNGATAVSKTVSVVSYGINKKLVGVYQNVSVPMSVFGFTSNSFNKIQIRFGGANADGVYIDYVQLQNSTVTETGSNVLTDLFLKDGTDSLFKVVGGNNFFVTRIAATTGNVGTLQQVSDLGSSTTNSLTASGFFAQDPNKVTVAQVGTSSTGSVWNGILQLHNGTGNNDVQLGTQTLTQPRIINLPDKSGTVALLSDITGGGGSTDTTSLSARINAKENTLTFQAPLVRSGNIISVDTTTAITGLVTKGFLASQNFGSGGGGGNTGSIYTTQTYTTGATVTIGNTVDWLIVNPTSSQTGLVITMPASPSDRQEVTISFGGTIPIGGVVTTSMTISANTGQSLVQSFPPTTMNAGESLRYRYNLSNTKWYAE